MTEHSEAVPIWGWYRLRGGNPTIFFRAMRMTKDFSYVGLLGERHGKAGEWLVEDREGKYPKALHNTVFLATYDPCEPDRPERVSPPDPAPPFAGPPVDPDKESI